MKVWRIKDWDDAFTCSQAARGRGIKRPSWVPIPIRLEGERYRMLMLQPGGVEAFGVFIALVEVAALCAVKGTLADDSGKPLSDSRLAVRTSIPVDVITRAIAVLSATEIGWLIEEAGANREPFTQPTQSKSLDPPSALRANDDSLGARSEKNGVFARAPATDRQRRGEEIRELSELGANGQSLGVSTKAPVCLSGSSPRGLLAGRGVREPALGELLRAGVTAEQVLEAWAAVDNLGVTNRPAAMVANLKDAFGIPRKKPRAHVGGALGAVEKRLQTLREQGKAREFELGPGRRAGPAP
jgi:hypothetical protein